MSRRRTFPNLSRVQDPGTRDTLRLVYDLLRTVEDQVEGLEQRSGETSRELSRLTPEVRLLAQPQTFATRAGVAPRFRVSGITPGHVLKSTAPGSNVAARFDALGAAELGLAKLGDLGDVDIAGAGAGDLLRFDGTSWLDGRPALDDLSDVVAPTPSDEDLIHWSSTNARWETREPGFLERCRLTHGAIQAIGDAAWTSLAFGTERFDPANMHDTAVNNSRITPGIVGAYLFGGHVLFGANATGDRGIRLLRNGATILSIFIVPNRGAADDVFLGLPASFTETSVSTDFFELQVFQDSGGNLGVGQVDEFTPEFWCFRVA